MPTAGQRDKMGIAHWCGFTAGVLLIAAAHGDPRHLRDLLDPGVILACGMAIALVTRWGFVTHKVPGSVKAITDAPSALELAASNERRIEELELRADVTEFAADVTDTKIGAVWGAIGRRNQADGFPVPDKDDTQPIRRLHAVRRPGEASLCGLAVAAALALRRDDRLRVPL